MWGKLGRRTGVPRPVVMLCAVVVAAASAAAAGCRSGQNPAAWPHASCGSAVVHFLNGDTQILTARRGALTCFVRAARRCRAASLAVTVMGVDTGTDYVFAIEPARAPCQVTEHSRYYSANFGGSQGPVTTATCRTTAATRKGVMLRCGRLDVLIPATVSAPSHSPA